MRNEFVFMKKLLTILSLVILALAFNTEVEVSSFDNRSDEDSFIFDRQKNDIESIFDNANSNRIILPELQTSLSSPSFRVVPSQKKTQQNLINNILLKRFSSEVQPTKNYNCKFSFPLSSKDDLIVIVRHLII